MLNSEDCVSALLEHGASALCRDSQGRTPLHIAASRGHTELLRCLLKTAMKADPLDSMQDHRAYTPTHWAAYHGGTSGKEFMSNALFNKKISVFNRLNVDMNIFTSCMYGYFKANKVFACYPQYNLSP